MADDNSKRYVLHDKAVEAVYQTLIQRIITLRKEQGISQEVLATMADIDRSHMGFIEQRRRDPTVATLHKICKALKISLEDLFKDL